MADKATTTVNSLLLQILSKAKESGGKLFTSATLGDTKVFLRATFSPGSWVDVRIDTTKSPIGRWKDRQNVNLLSWVHPSCIPVRPGSPEPEGKVYVAKSLIGDRSPDEAATKLLSWFLKQDFSKKSAEPRNSGISVSVDLDSLV